MTYNGKPFRAGDFAKDIERAMLTQVKEQLRERFSAIRHPETGEFPTVVVHGEALDDLRLAIEGSPELLAIVKERLNPNEAAGIEFKELSPGLAPKAFLSYAFDDRDVAERVANALMASGIDVWWAEWEMRAGDSLRQRIDEGLGGCTHFIVLLTPNSLEKPWVNQEMDAGLVRRISGKARFIALRHNLSPKQLPPLLSGMLSPTIADDDFAASIRDLVNDIHGVSRKPVLGSPPDTTALTSTKYSKLAMAIAKVLVEASPTALFGDVQRSTEDLAAATNASVEDVEDALHELRDVVRVSFERVMPKDELYPTFDKYFLAWNPADDALRIATDLVADAAGARDVEAVATRYGWDRRRMNSALSYLCERKLIHDFKTIANDWRVFQLRKTDGTRRFVRSRS